MTESAGSCVHAWVPQFFWEVWRLFFFLFVNSLEKAVVLPPPTPAKPTMTLQNWKRSIDTWMFEVCNEKNALNTLKDSSNTFLLEFCSWRQIIHFAVFIMKGFSCIKAQTNQKCTLCSVCVEPKELTEEMRNWLCSVSAHQQLLWSRCEMYWLFGHQSLKWHKELVWKQTAEQAQQQPAF